LERCLIRVNRRCRIPVALLLGLAAVLAVPAPSHAQVKVIISGGFFPAYREVIPEFERTTGIEVSTASGASQGTGPDTIGAMLSRGELADVVIMNRSGLAELLAQGRIVPGTDRNLAQTLTGVAVRAGAPKPDISTVEAFKQSLLRAKRIASPGSSTATITDVLSRLGISRDVTVTIPSRGTESVAMVARGQAALSIQPVSEILNMPGVELAGTIPTELQHVSVYAAAIVAGTKESESSKRLIVFLSSDGVTAAIKKSGMEPSPRR
jgi:molybdate transport system substrate-binding protein